jgi:hypothetical protein
MGSVRQIPTAICRRDGSGAKDPRNARTDDELGGAGRVYFVDANGHRFEVTC